MIIIKEVNPNHPDAIYLMDKLSQSLKAITGNSGRGSFDVNDVCLPRSLFVIAYNEIGDAIGCGAIRPLNENIAEVKRMYANIKGVGVGTEILDYLESHAEELGYSAIRLETRLVNLQAVAFYGNRGYHRIPNYGKYDGNPEAVCFEKQIISVNDKLI